MKHAQANLDEAYDKFFKEPTTGYPKFKSKHKCRWSYTTDNNGDTVRFDGKRLKLPKVGYVKVVEHRQHEGRILTATISKERSGEYYASVLCEVEQQESLPVTDKVVGIDLGLHDLIVCSDGTQIEAPKHFRKSEQKFREWTCPECGEVHDRDLNASRNILKEGLKSIEPTERGG